MIAIPGITARGEVVPIGFGVSTQQFSREREKKKVRVVRPSALQEWTNA